MVRTPDGTALLVADEDHRALRVIPLPLTASAAVGAVSLPGPPASVLSLGKRVLVTIRDPGLLLFLRHEGGELREEARVPVSADAWGLAVTADLRTALVTSAWTHELTAVDLASGTVRWTASLAREPRGISITSAGVAYVSHLVGSRLTRVEALAGSEPKITRVELPAAPMRAAYGTLLNASLGYASVLNADESRLFAGRHALGGQAARWWFGAATVDGLLTATDEPVSPPHQPNSQGSTFDMTSLVDIQGSVPLAAPSFVQPRALAFRKSTNTILVASEGKNDLVELDARAVDPTLARTALYELGSYEKVEAPYPALVLSGGAPSAIALSSDESKAYVFCRSTYDVQEVGLRKPGEKDPTKETPPLFVTIATDSLDTDAAKGRKLFYDATDTAVSGGLGCAGCHPEGRDDGHVWHELSGDVEFANGYRGATVLSSLAGAMNNAGRTGTATGYPGFARQTPMLAGRVKATGPYGWLGESPNLESRLRAGFGLHRWQGSKAQGESMVALDRPKYLARFLREGLSTPPVDAHELTAEELRGKAVFEDPKTQCATCHDGPELTNRSVVPLSRPPHKGFDPESAPFKTPSLLFVGGSPPYFHDGTSGSLEELVEKNGAQMGNTSHLDAARKKALVAYLRTLGGYVAPFPEEAPMVAPKIEPGNVTGLGRRPDHDFWRGIKDTPYPRGFDCSVRREGVWFHITCPKTISGIQLLAGPVAGTETWFGKREDFVGATGHLVFPVREGERKVFQFTREVTIGRWGTTLESAWFVQVDWPNGQPEPTLIFSLP